MLKLPFIYKFFKKKAAVYAAYNDPSGWSRDQGIRLNSVELN